MSPALAVRPPPRLAPPRALAGRVALVTFAAGGRGLALARALGAAGADLALHAAGDPGALAWPRVRLAAEHGVRVAAFAADLRAHGAAVRLMADATRLLGPVDILVHDAEAGAPASGAAIRAALPFMAARGWGRIVAVAGPASALAHGLAELARGAALAGAGRGVTANVVCPRGGPEAAVGALVALLCGDGAALLTGGVLPVDPPGAAA